MPLREQAGVRPLRPLSALKPYAAPRTGRCPGAPAAVRPALCRLPRKCKKA